MDFRAQIERRRLAAGLSRNLLARLAGMAQPDLVRLLRPGSNPRHKTLQRIARALNLSITIEGGDP